MLGYWHYELDERQWLLSIAAKAEHQLRRAERWERELADVEAGGGSPRDVEDKLADFVRREQFARSERRIIRTCQERFGGELEAPEEPPTPRAYALAWALAILINAYFAYFLVAMGSGLCANQIFNPTSMCDFATVSTQSFLPCFENSTRAIDPSKNQPNRLRFDRDREF